MYNIDIFNKWNQSITQQFIDQQTINEKVSIMIFIILYHY